MSAGAVGSADVVSGAFPVWASAAAAFPGERVSAPSLRGPELVGGGGARSRRVSPCWLLVLSSGSLSWGKGLGPCGSQLRLVGCRGWGGVWDAAVLGAFWT